ncbi:MAG: AsmA family protein [Alphaproteobacteria bacterium]|nr:MAG: AsmA family protein [Alphaproteobacteria bacterium]
MKKGILIGLVIVLVLAGGALYAISQLGNIVKGGIESEGPTALKVPVDVASVTISPFSGKASLSGLSLGQPNGFGDGAMASIGSFDMALEPKSLFTDHIIIDYITVDAPLLDVRVTDKGKTNFKAFQDGLGLPASDETESDITLTIRKLVVRAPKLAIQSDGMVKMDKEIALADFTLTDIGTDEKGLAPREIARHVMDTLQPQIAKALVQAGAGEKLQNLADDARGKLEDKLGGVLGKLKKKEESGDQPNN